MSLESESKPAPKKKAFRHRLHQWMRWLHTYVSMGSLIIIFFFAITGITLNHPDWNIGGKERIQKVSGTLFEESVANGKVDWLRVVEQIRKEQPVHGTVGDTRIDGDQGSFTMKGPGMDSECFFDLGSRKYQLSMTSQGLVGLMNDFHRGHDSGKAWPWVIDFAGGFLAILAISGFTIIFYLKKSRTAGLILAAIGVLVFIGLIIATTR